MKIISISAIDRKGRLYIPKHLRDALKLEDTDRIAFWLDDKNKVILTNEGKVGV